MALYQNTVTGLVQELSPETAKILGGWVRYTHTEDEEEVVEKSQKAKKTVDLSKAKGITENRTVGNKVGKVHVTAAQKAAETKQAKQIVVDKDNQNLKIQVGGEPKPLDPVDPPAGTPEIIAGTHKVEPEVIND